MKNSHPPPVKTATDGEWLMAKDRPRLVLCPDRLDRFVQLALRRPQMLFRLRAMPLHIVVVGGAGHFQLMDRFVHVVMDLVQVMPVTNLIGNRNPSGKRQTHTENGNYNRFRHDFFLSKIVN
jgi:hypothetical protein